MIGPPKDTSPDFLEPKTSISKKLFSFSWYSEKCDIPSRFLGIVFRHWTLVLQRWRGQQKELAAGCFCRKRVTVIDLHVCEYVYMYVRVNVCLHIYIHMCEYIYIYMLIGFVRDFSRRCCVICRMRTTRREGKHSCL